MSVEVALRFSSTICLCKHKYFRQVSNQYAINGLSIDFMLYNVDIVNFNYIIFE